VHRWAGDRDTRAHGRGRTHVRSCADDNHRGRAASAGVTMTTPSDPDEIAKQAREHAWNWFALHATQRMQAFNFFVVATAFLIAA